MIHQLVNGFNHEHADRASAKLLWKSLEHNLLARILELVQKILSVYLVVENLSNLTTTINRHQSIQPSVNIMTKNKQML